jgi:hypothetical protein
MAEGLKNDFNVISLNLFQKEGVPNKDLAHLKDRENYVKSDAVINVYGLTLIDMTTKVNAMTHMQATAYGKKLFDKQTAFDSEIDQEKKKDKATGLQK